MSPLPAGVQGGYTIPCMNPECGAVYMSERLECPPDWTELADGFLCPRERVVITWQPAAPEDELATALAANAEFDAQLDAAERALADEATAADQQAALEAQRAELAQRLAEQEAAEAALREQVGREAEAATVRARRAERIRKRLGRGPVTQSGAVALIVEHYGDLPEAERAAILALVLS